MNLLQSSLDLKSVQGSEAEWAEEVHQVDLAKIEVSKNS